MRELRSPLKVFTESWGAVRLYVLGTVLGTIIFSGDQLSLGATIELLITQSAWILLILGALHAVVAIIRHLGDRL